MKNEELVKFFSNLNNYCVHIPKPLPITIKFSDRELQSNNLVSGSNMTDLICSLDKEKSNCQVGIKF